MAVTVSVIINCLNGERYLREAIESVFAQTYDDWEIVFWNNASTDRSLEIAESFGERVRCFSSDVTTPLGRARNLAIEQARGRYLAFLDADDVWLPVKLERQIPVLDADPTVGLVFSDTFFFNSRGESWRLYGQRIPPHGLVFRRLVAHYYLSMETVIIRRSALDSLDEWFDDRLTIVEEMDLFTRLAFYYRFGYVHEPLSRWRIHAASWTQTRPDLFVDETEIVLKKLTALCKGATDYGVELEIRRKELERSRVLYAWRSGDGQLARRILRESRLWDRSSLLLWVATFVPYSTFTAWRARSGALMPR